MANPIKLFVDGVEASISFGEPTRVFLGVDRRVLTVDGFVGLSGFSFERGGTLQLALFVDADFEVPRHIRFGEDLDDVELSRLVQPGAGIAVTIGEPWPVVATSFSSKWAPFWAELAARPWEKVDVAWTFTTGSPRNRFFSELERAGIDSPLRFPGLGIMKAIPFVGASADTARVLDRSVRYQLQRRFQHRGIKAYPAALAGAPCTNLPSYALPGVGTVTAHDSHHFTLQPLAAAFRLTGSPLALDQICALLTHALATEAYFDAGWHWPYGNIPRPAGWLNVALADALECLPFGFPWTSPLYEKVLDVAHEHVQLQRSIGFSPEGRSNLFGGPDARHLLVDCNFPWQDAVQAFGLLRLDELAGIEGAREHGIALLDSIEAFGWNPATGVAYDSIPHFAKDFGVAPKASPGNGIGTWIAPALVLANRLDSPLLAALVKTAKAAKIGGKPWFSPFNWQAVSSFGPLVEG